MPSPYADFKKDGLDKLLRVARVLCAVVNQFAHILVSKYSDKPAILALVTAIQTVCSLLPEAQVEFDEIPLEDAGVSSDVAEYNGINPSAPPAPDPIVV